MTISMPEASPQLRAWKPCPRSERRPAATSTYFTFYAEYNALCLEQATATATVSSPGGENRSPRGIACCRALVLASCCTAILTK